MLSERSSQQCCVLNGGGGAWAFEPLATQLSSFFGIEVSKAPRRFNYLLNFDDTDGLASERLFIPLEAIFLASDKRLLSAVFSKEGVPTLAPLANGLRGIQPQARLLLQRAVTRKAAFLEHGLDLSEVINWLPIHPRDRKSSGQECHDREHFHAVVILESSLPSGNSIPASFPILLWAWWECINELPERMI